MIPRPLLPLALSCALATGATAQSSVSTDHDAIRTRALTVLETQFGAFRDAAATLEDTARGYCAGTGGQSALETAFRDAWHAWAPLDSYQFGPVEQLGAALSVNFWPDKKNIVGRALDALSQQPAEAQADPATIAAGSAAAQGLPALERLLHTDATPCPAIIGISAHLDGMAGDLYAAWFAPDGWAALMRAAGPDNPIYLSEEEVTRTLFTAADFALTRVADYRLGRPLGTYERSYPRRAEAWRSGLSAEIAAAQLRGITELFDTAFGPALKPDLRTRFDMTAARAEARLETLDQPLAEEVSTPSSRIRVEAAQTLVRELQQLLNGEIGPELGVETGFSAADGD
ncbi:imelysin family protein [Tropicimonas sp.]|uniref:imelysin family protein n=1 Tax=Tropicimonas sp. TaxID=2067044 RepID=UPI003A8A47B2